MRYAQPGLTLWLIQAGSNGTLAVNDEIPDGFTVSVQTGYTEFYLFPDQKSARKYIDKYLPLDPSVIPIRDIPLLNAHPATG